MPGTERFMIVAEARPRAVPPARPLLEVAEALPNIPPPVAVPPPAPPVADVEVPPAPPPKAASPAPKGAAPKGK
jgi:hypothetical protein